MAGRELMSQFLDLAVFAYTILFSLLRSGRSSLRMDPPRSLLNNPPMAQGGDTPLVNPPWVLPSSCGARRMFSAPRFVASTRTVSSAFERCRADSACASVRCAPTPSGVQRRLSVVKQNCFFVCANSSLSFFLLNADAPTATGRMHAVYLSAGPTATLHGREAKLFLRMCEQLFLSFPIER